MTPQKLDRPLTAYRIGDPGGAYPIFDATGSTLAPGRWNSPDSPIIYASEHFSTAILEKLAHGSGMLPPNQHFVTITLSAGLSYEVFPAHGLPGWDTFPATTSRMFGSAWCRERRSLLLFVPSVVARVERNIVINPAHPEFARIGVSLHEPVHWDRRLFGAPR